MNNPIKLFATLLFSALFFARANATLWTGTITETITETDDFRNYVGQTAIGSYQYESDSVDGTFALWPTNQNNLTATLFTFKSDGLNGGQIDLSTGFYERYTFLTVQNGIVTDFHKEGQTGYDFGFSFSSFSTHYYYYPLGGTFHLHNKGTMEFGAPQPVSDSGCNTVILFAAAGVLLTAARRRFLA